MQKGKKNPLKITVKEPMWQSEQLILLKKTPHREEVNSKTPQGGSDKDPGYLITDDSGLNGHENINNSVNYN